MAAAVQGGGVPPPVARSPLSRGFGASSSFSSSLPSPSSPAPLRHPAPHSRDLEQAAAWRQRCQTKARSLRVAAAGTVQGLALGTV